MSEGEPTPSGRSKRQKHDKAGRLSALEKLKRLKGSKNKCEISEIENVYDQVDERSYSKTVLERQNDDWIVDDGGTGYVEDGREIFDDDLDDQSIQEAAKKGSLAGPRKRKKVEIKEKGNLKSMFMNMSSKKKRDETLSNDDILGDLMSELQKDVPASKPQDSAVRNKFRVAKTQFSETPELPGVERSKVGEDFDEPIFESARREAPPALKKKRTYDDKATEDISGNLSNRSTSQNIESGDSQTLPPVEESPTVENGASQNIETPDSRFDDDLGDIDFDEMDMNMTETSRCTAMQTIIEPKTAINSTSVDNYKNEKLKDTEPELMDEAWAEDFGEQLTEAEFTKTSSSDKKIEIPMSTNEQGEQVFRFYWWDAYEDRYNMPGMVYLFGKCYNESTKSYVSCCVHVKNIPRRIHLLPREFMENSRDEDGEPTRTKMLDVYDEFNEWASKKQITEFRSKNVKKLYAFESAGTPLESDYLEVRYAATYPSMDSNYSGRAIEKVFGTTVNALELLLIERGIKGPGWLEIRNPIPVGSQNSWCKLQINCLKLENIRVSGGPTEKFPSPPLSIATVNVRTCLNSKQQHNEIVMIGVLLHSQYHIEKPAPKPLFQQHLCLVTHPRSIPWPRHARDSLARMKNTKVVRTETESELLEEFLELMEKNDPDLVVGYDCGFQLDVMMHRIANLKIKNWSRVGKLKRTAMPMMKGKINLGQVFCGRPICDIQNSAKELNLKVRSYDLRSLCAAVLKKTIDSKEINPVDCPQFFADSEKIEKLVQITMNEALFIITLFAELNIVPLAVQITCLAGNTLSRTLSAGRAERNEFLLLHAFYQKNYITPDKRFSAKNKENPEKSRRKKAAYAGGLVLEPKKGFYDQLILLMDFNSLYPSIIQEYNICFSTIPGAAYADAENLSLPSADLEPGVVPTEIRKLVESRGEVKKLMKAPNVTPELKMQYNIRQLALKLTANSMYGCLGAGHCRFYAKGLAELVTGKGREILQNTKTLVEKLSFEVIYGDTDSIMINTKNLNYDEALATAKKIKQEVNKLYKRVELDIDGVFRYLLLLQKKKYAAVLMNKTANGQIELITEHKGLDIVRRDWCQIACDTGKKVLDQLLSDQPQDTRLEKVFEILNNVATGIREAQVPLSALVLTKQLSKNPKDYPEQKLPHVAIAMRLNKKGGRMWKAGDVVPYIICEDGTLKSPTERAYHVDEYKKNDELKIDVDYYILSQIFPVILRICDPIKGIDDVLLAKHLGLEHIYKSKRVIHEQEDVQVPLQMDEDRYKYCLPLKIQCRNDKCKADIEIKEFFADFSTGRFPALYRCTNAECNKQPWSYVKSIQNQLQCALRKNITEYYGDFLECEDPICSNRTRHLPMNMRGNYPRCDVCKEGNMHRIYSETKLYNQLSFYLHLFDVSQVTKSQPQHAYPQEMISAYDTLKEFVENQLRRNAYSIVDLDAIFAIHSHNNEEKTVADEEELSEFEFSDDEPSPDAAEET